MYDHEVSYCGCERPSSRRSRPACIKYTAFAASVLHALFFLRCHGIISALLRDSPFCLALLLSPSCWLPHLCSCQGLTHSPSHHLCSSQTFTHSASHCCSPLPAGFFPGPRCQLLSCTLVQTSPRAHKRSKDFSHYPTRPCSQPLLLLMMCSSSRQGLVGPSAVGFSAGSSAGSSAGLSGVVGLLRTASP